MCPRDKDSERTPHLHGLGISKLVRNPPTEFTPQHIAVDISKLVTSQSTQISPECICSSGDVPPAASAYQVDTLNSKLI